MNEEEKKYFGKEEKKMKVEDNNNSDSDSETTEGESDAESEGGHKDSKRGNDGNADDSLVVEEKDNPFEHSSIHVS